MKPCLAATALLLPMLAGCNDPAPAPANTATVANAVAPEDNYAIQVRALPPRQRQGVFLRAVRDGKEQCQEVTEEYEIDAVQGRDAWAVTCDKTNHWIVSIDPGGTAIVTKVSPTSRLPAKTS